MASHTMARYYHRAAFSKDGGSGESNSTRAVSRSHGDRRGAESGARRPRRRRTTRVTNRWSILRGHDEDTRRRLRLGGRFPRERGRHHGPATTVVDALLRGG